MSKPRWGGAPSDKCVGCTKTVYPAEKLVMEGQIWHIECLRCKECGKKLGGANWGGFMPPNNEAYCKIHFDRIIISSGKGGASSTTSWTPKESSSEGGEKPKSRFGGACAEKCEKCGKTCYPAERLLMEGRMFHAGCLRCDECNKNLTGANFGGFTPDGVYCTVHLKQKVSALGSATTLSGPSAWVPKEKDANAAPSKWGSRPTDVCEACGKTVYPAEKFSIEGRIFHIGCLKCKECGKKLGGANWGGFMPPENDAYCKIHFDRIVVSRGKGGVSTTKEWVPKESSSDKPKSKFGGAPKEKCVKCGKTVYPAEKVSMEGQIYHGPCLRCTQCNKALTGANWGAFVPPNNDPYCKTHYMQMVARIGDSTKLSGTGATGQ